MDCSNPWTHTHFLNNCTRQVKLNSDIADRQTLLSQMLKIFLFICAEFYTDEEENVCVLFFRELSYNTNLLDGYDTVFIWPSDK